MLTGRSTRSPSPPVVSIRFESGPVGDSDSSRLSQIAARALAVAEVWDQLRADLRDLLQEECDRRSQKVVADELRISAQYLNDLTRGRRKLSIRMIRKLIGVDKHA